MRTPTEILRHAAALSKVNPKAFPTEEVARISLSTNFQAMERDKAIQALCIGGYMLRRAYENECIELWVSPDIAFRALNKE